MGSTRKLLSALALGSVLLSAGCAASGSAAGGSTDGGAHAAARAVDGLRLRDLDGVEHDVAASLDAGRAVVLVFWQTWCGPCRREAPGLVEAARTHAGRMDFIGIVPGTDENVDVDEVRTVAQAWDLPYPQVRDRDLSLTSRFEVTGTPDIIVLAPNGTIAYRGHSAPEDWSALL